MIFLFYLTVCFNGILKSNNFKISLYLWLCKMCVTHTSGLCRLSKFCDLKLTWIGAKLWIRIFKLYMTFYFYIYASPVGMECSYFLFRRRIIKKKRYCLQSLKNCPKMWLFSSLYESDVIHPRRIILDWKWMEGQAICRFDGHGDLEIMAFL